MSLPSYLRYHVLQYNVFELPHDSCYDTNLGYFSLIVVLESLIGVVVSRRGTLTFSTQG